jgi:hypothetical protein
LLMDTSRYCGSNWEDFSIRWRLTICQVIQRCKKQIEKGVVLWGIHDEEIALVDEGILHAMHNLER